MSVVPPPHTPRRSSRPIRASAMVVRERCSWVMVGGWLLLLVGAPPSNGDAWLVAAARARASVRARARLTFVYSRVRMC